MLQDRNGGHVFSLSISASVRPCHLLFVLSSVRPAFCPVKKTIYFRSLLKNTERISMKIVGENYYHEQIKWSLFWRKWNWNKGAWYDRIFESTSVGGNYR